VSHPFSANKKFKPASNKNEKAFLRQEKKRIPKKDNMTTYTPKGVVVKVVVRPINNPLCPLVPMAEDKRDILM
jgi:acyl-CoA reductase-like NAD-dependent aldehyde dehydrogenase